MNGREFFVSAPGRLTCAVGTFAFAAPGILALRGPGPYDIQLAAIIILLTIVGCVFAAVLSAQRYFLVAAAYGALLPFLAFFYVALATHVSALGPAVGGILIAISLLPLATAVAAPLRPVQRGATPTVGAEARVTR